MRGGGPTLFLGRGEGGGGANMLWGRGDGGTFAIKLYLCKWEEGQGWEGCGGKAKTHPSWKQPSLLEEPLKAAFQYIHQKFLVLISAFQ